MPELVTSSLSEYESLGLALARDPSRLASIRCELEQRRVTAPLFDVVRFCRDLERAYLTMRARLAQGEHPAHFSVTPTERTN